METLFTPWHSLFGGILIGSAAVLMLWGCGQILGVSGLLSRLLPPWSSSQDIKVRVAFVAGVIALPLLAMVSGQVSSIPPVNGNPLYLGLAGLVMGYGTVRGNGCTSGHGVCGISRLSQRSIVATLVFMATAAVTVYIARHLLGWI